jgi:hypothetical protein
MRREEISIKELKEMNCDTFMKKDNSVRGCDCVSKSQIKVGDMVVISNYFTLVTE